VVKQGRDEETSCSQGLKGSIVGVPGAKNVPSFENHCVSVYRCNGQMAESCVEASGDAGDSLD